MSLSLLQAQYSGAMSKHGWPRGKFHHRIGSVRNSLIRDACDGVFMVSNLPDRTDVMSFDLGDCGYSDIVVYGAIGVEEYAKLRSFLDGFNFANSR